MEVSNQSRRAALLAALAFGAASLAGAQEAFPARPIAIIVPAAAGGYSDVTARLVAQALTRDLGQSVIVDNRAGGTGLIGMQAVARAQPDGYTLGWGGNSPLVIVPYLRKAPPYDPLRAFSPISMGTTSPYIIAVSPTSSVRTLPELLAQGKANPGKLSYATSGVGGTSHLATELLGRMAGIQTLHIPFKGGSENATSVIAGHVDFPVDASASLLPLINGGKLRALAVTGDRRMPQLPDVPTVAEQGLAGYRVETFIALLGPAGVPQPVIDKLAGAMQRVLAQPAMSEAFLKAGAFAVSSSPQELNRVLHADADKWQKMIREVGIPME